MSYVFGEQRADLFLPPSGQGRVVGAEVREEGRARTQPWQSDFYSSKAHIEELSVLQKTNSKPKKLFRRSLSSHASLSEPLAYFIFPG